MSWPQAAPSGPASGVGPPGGRRVSERLREGSRLYSYLLRGNITALKPHNLLPHPAGAPAHPAGGPPASPPHARPALPVSHGHRSWRAGQAQGRRRAGGKVETAPRQERQRVCRLALGGPGLGFHYPPPRCTCGHPGVLRERSWRGALPTWLPPPQGRPDTELDGLPTPGMRVDRLGVAGQADPHCPPTLPSLSCQPAALSAALSAGARCSPDPAQGGLSLGLMWGPREAGPAASSGRQQL